MWTCLVSVHSSKHRACPVPSSSEKYSWQYSLTGAFIPPCLMLYVCVSWAGLMTGPLKQSLFFVFSDFLGQRPREKCFSGPLFSPKNLKKNKF